MKAFPTAPDLPATPSTDAAPPRTLSRFHLRLLILALTIAGASWITHLASRQAARHRPILALLDQLSLGSGPERLEARRQLLELGPQTAPVLVRIVRQGKSRLQTDLLPWLDAIPQIQRWRNRQLRLERGAIDTLQRMGAAAAPAVLPLLADSKFGGRESAIALLRTYGPQTCPDLIACLDSPRPALRAGAALALGRFHSTEQGGLDHLIRARHDPHPQVRTSALWALGQMADQTEGVVPELVGALTDPSPVVRLEALEMLRGFGPASAPALPALRRILDQGPDDLRVEATLALAAIGIHARAAEPELLATLAGADPHAARQAAATLIELGIHRPPSLDHLSRCLEHPDPRFRIRSLEVVGNLGTNALPLIPALLRLLDNDEPRDDRPTVHALWNIDPGSVPERFRRRRTGRP